MLTGMPTQPRKPSDKDNQPSSKSRAKRCEALTTGGSPCGRQVVAGLNVCKSHGGATAASVRVGRRAVASQQAAVLWGISTDTSGLSVEDELRKMAKNKMTDILALRIELSQGRRRHIGMLTESESEITYDIEGTVQSKSGTQETKSRRNGVSPWVAELHKAETELLAILRLLAELTGNTDELDTRRIRMQTAREAARLLKAFPGISVDEVAAEVSKNAS
jgi:hypothetical protein